MQDEKPNPPAYKRLTKDHFTRAGQKGGRAAAANMSPEARKERARKAGLSTKMSQLKLLRPPLPGSSGNANS